MYVRTYLPIKCTKLDNSFYVLLLSGQGLYSRKLEETRNHMYHMYFFSPSLYYPEAGVKIKTSFSEY